MSHALAKYHAARHALAVCKNVDEVKDILDKAEAMRAYGVIANDATLEHDAIEIRLRAERRLGEMIGQQKAGSGLAKPGPKPAANSVDPSDRSPTLADAGISKDLSARAQNIAAVPEKEFEKEIAGFRDRTKQDGKQVQTRLNERGKEVRGKPAKPKPPEPDHDNRLAAAIKEMDMALAENLDLQARIDALTVTDLAKKVDELVRANTHAVREKDMEMDKNAILLKRANDAERFRSEVVKISGSQNPKAAIQWVKSMAATQRQSA